MKTSHHFTCIKSGLPLTNPGVCLMCKRSCRFAGSRGKRYQSNRARKSTRKPLVQ